MKLDIRSLALVQGIEKNEYKPLGTAFCFLKPQWFVTAKHVLEENHSLLRDKLTLNVNGKFFSASDIWIHDKRDIALLDLGESVCPKPFYPSHWDYDRQKGGLIKFAYSPSDSRQKERPIYKVSPIVDFETQERSREDGTELLFEFDDEYSEGGNSGGPICSASGGVVGIIIDGTSRVNTKRTTATDVKVLLELVELNNIILNRYRLNGDAYVIES